MDLVILSELCLLFQEPKKTPVERQRPSLGDALEKCLSNRLYQSNNNGTISDNVSSDC